MDIPIDAEVICVDGPAGRTTTVILNPETRVVTHMVIAETGLLGAPRVVPINVITSSTPHHVQLRLTRAELQELPPFTRAEFLDPEYTLPGYAAGELLAWRPPYEPAFITTEAVPQGEFALHQGDEVRATDGRIGQIDELLTDPTDNRITHVVLQHGHLWDKRAVTIPIEQVERIEPGIIYLKLSKEQVAALPDAPDDLR